MFIQIQSISKRGLLTLPKLPPASKGTAADLQLGLLSIGGVITRCLQVELEALLGMATHSDSPPALEAALAPSSEQGSHKAVDFTFFFWAVLLQHPREPVSESRTLESGFVWLLYRSVIM